MSSDNKAANRRIAERISSEIEVNYESLDGFRSDYATNISKGGLFISTKSPLPKGSPVKLHINLDGKPLPVELKGEVLWTIKADEENQKKIVAGMGIKFVDISAETRKAIESVFSISGRRK
jgi:type IV pilus assembly protein PilZ